MSPREGRRARVESFSGAIEGENGIGIPPFGLRKVGSELVRWLVSAA